MGLRVYFLHRAHINCQEGQFVSLKKYVTDGSKNTCHDLDTQNHPFVLGFSPDEGSVEYQIIATLTSNIASKEFFCGAAAGACRVMTLPTACCFVLF